MFGNDLCSLIVTDGNGVYGTSLFLGAMPDAPDVCVVVTESGGWPPLDFFSEASPGLERPRAQVRTRGVAHDYETPRLAAERVARELHARGAFVVNSTRYLDLRMVQTPFPLGKDDNHRWIFAVNMEALKELTSL